MSESESGNDVETCQMAMEAAFEKGIGFCETQEARIEVLSQVVGLEGSDRDFDVDGVLDDGPGAGSGSVQTRQWVLARADEIIDEGSQDPLDAVNQAWVEAADEMAGGSGPSVGDGEAGEDADEEGGDEDEVEAAGADDEDEDPTDGADSAPEVEGEDEDDE